MAMSAVSSVTTSAIQQQQPAAARQPEFKPAERPRESDDASKVRATQTKTQQTQQAQAQQQVQEAQRTEAQRPAQPKPVVNAQGQKMGGIINTSA